MRFVRGKGYWEDKLYWMIAYQDQYVCFILLHGSGSEAEFAPWTIWSDDSDSPWYADFPLDAHMRQTAWKHVDICGNCGGCGNPGGSRKTVFGREFDHVCRTTLRFVNPDREALACAEKMVEIRKADILRRAPML